MLPSPEGMKSDRCYKEDQDHELLYRGLLRCHRQWSYAVILPHAITFNTAAVPDLQTPVLELFGQAGLGLGLWNFAKASGAPLALRDLGLKEADLDRAADIALANPYWNPRPVTRGGIRQLLQAVWAGEMPAG